MTERTRVVITGMGVKSPAGNDLESFWATLTSGVSAAGPISLFDTKGHPVTFACEVRDFDPVAYLGPKESRRVDRVAQLGFAAAADALTQAGELDADPARCAVFAGTGIGGLTTLEEQIRQYWDKGPSRVSPFLVPMMMPNATAAVIAMQYGFTGVNECVVTACAAGSHALGEGARLIRDGSADVVVAGGSEASITPVGLAAFHRMGALSGRSDDPARASRPFDAERDGFVMGEGAGFVVLEAYNRAVARGATILGELGGYGRTCDAHHITAPAPGGAGAVACMQQALEDAGVAPEHIGHINAHGTSTPLNDAAEAEAISKVFGDGGPPVTSVKGCTGHLIGAAGAVEAIASLLAFRHGKIPPTANHERSEPAITVDVVHGEPRPVRPAPALSNSFGFGGHNASLVLLPAS
jgi:3-oxoacyl-[acyl-carrier-protein] synthase II